MTNKTDARAVYADIIDLPHHQSTKRKHMSSYDRAAQFASYKSLRGYEDMVAEEARLTEEEIELSDNEIDMLNAVIGELSDRIDCGDRPLVGVTYFKPDPYKAGGRYETLTAVIKKVDAISGRLLFYGSDDVDDRRVPPIDIPIDKILQINMR